MPAASGVRRQHDEAALGAGDVDRRVEHQRQHFIEHAARAERAQAFEQRRELAQVVDRAGVRSIGVRGPLAGEEHHVGAAGAAELDAIAVRQLVLGDRFAVDVGAIAGSLVFQDPVAVLLDDLGVLARHVTAHQPQVALGAAADAQQLFVDGDDALAEAVVYFEARVRRGHNRPIIAGLATSTSSEQASAGHFPGHGRQRQPEQDQPGDHAAAAPRPRRRRWNSGFGGCGAALVANQGVGGDLGAARSAFHRIVIRNYVKISLTV